VVCGPPPITRIVKILLVLNVAAFVTLLLLERFVALPALYGAVALTPQALLKGIALWQLVTTFFVHFEPWHILSNMLALYVFGPNLERRLGSRPFLRLYMLSGLCGSVCIVVLAYVLAALSPVYSRLPGGAYVGASSAIFGLLVAYAMLFPDHIFLLMFIAPVRARTLAIGFIAFDALMLVLGRDMGIAYTGHLGGALGGWLFIRAISKQPPKQGRSTTKRYESTVIEGRFKEIMRDVDD